MAPLAILMGVALAVRLRLPGPLRWIRRFNKRAFNHLTMPLAGQRGSPFALLRHRGRRSGRLYATPVVAFPAGEGFRIALTYGPQTDWCRNVRAAGQATLVAGGVARTVRSPVVVDQAAALPAFPPLVRLACRALGIREFLMVVDAGPAPLPEQT